MDKNKLPKRFVQVDGQMVEKKEKPEIIEKLCGIDVGAMLEEFGSDKLGARNYVRKHTGANALTAYGFVRKAYWSMGRGYDESLPQVCSDRFFKKYNSVTDDKDLRSSPLLRYLEIICSDKELLFVSQCTVRTRNLMQIKKGTISSDSNQLEAYWDISEFVKTDEIKTVMNNGLFVITEEGIILICEGIGIDDNRIYLDNSIYVNDIKGVFFRLDSNGVDILVADSCATNGFVAVTLKGQGHSVSKIVSDICDSLRFERNRRTDELYVPIHYKDTLLWKGDKVVGFVWDEEASSDISRREYINNLYDLEMMELCFDKDVTGFINIMDEYLYSGRHFKVVVIAGSHVWRWAMIHNPLTTNFIQDRSMMFLFESEDKGNGF